MTASSIGDAKSLQGGTLVATTLMGLDGNGHAEAQGTVQTGAISAWALQARRSQLEERSYRRPHRRRGDCGIGGKGQQRLPTGGQYDRPAPTLRKNPDFSTAQRVADVINARFPGCAQLQNPTIVAIRPPPGENMAGFVGQVENLSVETDTPAKVIIDEIAGVVTMTDAVRISTVAIQQGNLTITVKESSQVSQPTAFSVGGKTAVVPQSDISVDEEKGNKFVTLKNGYR